ncbi:MAG: hypothetical protein ABR985_13830 [Methanotrichaceae archaeon]
MFKEAVEKETGILTEVDTYSGSPSCPCPTAGEPTTVNLAG